MSLESTLAGAAAELVSTVEIRTAITPAVRLNVASLGSGASASSTLQRLLLGLLRPTVVLEGNLGTHVVAPAGAAGEGGGLAGALLLLALVSVPFALGVALARS